MHYIIMTERQIIKLSSNYISSLILSIMIKAEEAIIQRHTTFMQVIKYMEQVEQITIITIAVHLVII